MAGPGNISAPQQVSGIDRASLLRAIPSLPLEIQDHIYCETLMSWSDEELDRTYFSKVKDDLYDDSRYSKAERNETFKLESVSMQRFAKLREDLLNATRNNPQVLEQPFRCLIIRALTKYDRRDAAVDAVNACKHDEQCHHLRSLLNTEETQSHAREDGKAVLSTVDQVREDIAGIVVTPQTLKCAPNAWDCCEETKKPRVGAVTHRRLIPVT